MSFSDDVISPRAREPEKSSSTCLILGLVFGGLGGLVLLCGGCCFGFMWFGFGEIERQVRAELAENPVIQEHIGEVRTFEMQKLESMQRMAQQPDTFVFRISGDKGSGTVEAVCRDDGTGTFEVISGQLILDSGESFPLVDGADVMAVPVPDRPSVVVEAGFAGSVRAVLEGHPVLSEHVGSIQSFTYDVDLSAAEPGEDVYVFQVAGSKGRGRLRTECTNTDGDSPEIEAAELILDSGESVQLFPDRPLP